MEEKQRGLIPTVQGWPLQLIEHLANTTSVAPPPAGPPPAGEGGCSPLYLLHLLNPSFTLGSVYRYTPISLDYDSRGTDQYLLTTSLGVWARTCRQSADDWLGAALKFQYMYMLLIILPF